VLDIVDGTFADLTGLACWGVEWEPQLGLKFSFGKPVMRVREPIVASSGSPMTHRIRSYRNVTVNGEWWFWCWTAEWELRLADDPRPITATSIPMRRMRSLRFLDGQRLLAAGVDPDNGITELLFDLGAALRLWADRSEPVDVWALYKPSGRVLLIRSDGLYSHERGTAAERWRVRA
jgi:hypothetical protein